MDYKVKFYKGEYRERQRNASRDRAVCYVEHHFNMTADRNTSCVIVGSNASRKSIEFGRDYVEIVSQHFGTKPSGDRGVVKGGYEGRGNGNVYYADCPAILLEPLFCGNPKHVAAIKSEQGQSTLAECLVFAIKQNFPEGGLVAFSVGHKYKTSKPKDRGAALLGGGSEADYAEKVLLKAAALLTQQVKIEDEAVAVKFSEDDETDVEPFLVQSPAMLPLQVGIVEMPTETKEIVKTEPVGFRGKLAKLFATATGGTFSIAMVKEWLQITISPETVAVLKLILPVLLVLGGVGLLVWFVSEKVTNWKLTKLQAEINSDKSRHDIVLVDK